MLFSRIGSYLVAAVMAVVCMNLQADELLMQNDDRLTGRIIRLEGDTVLFQSPYAGTLRIPRTQIRRHRCLRTPTPRHRRTPTPQLPSCQLSRKICDPAPVDEV